MMFRRAGEKEKNCIMMILTIIVNIMLLSLFFDFYYDLNDDVLMKDILSGAYTGTPEGRNMQNLYLLGAVISLCYRIYGNIPWYGLFLLLCQMGSLYLVGCRLLAGCRKMWQKAGCMTLVSVFIWGILLSHIVAVQYTVTCTMLAAAAIFLFLTTPRGLSAGQFVICNIPSILMVILAYQLRTEMLLLLFPLICLAGLFRWTAEEQFFCAESYRKYGVTIGLILGGMLVSRLADFAAYSSEEWKAFLTFFQNRTQLYDFHYDVLTSGEHRDELLALGISDAQQTLLANYNFGLDERIDEVMLGEIADYAAGTAGADEGEASFIPADFPEKIRFYVYRTLHSGDAPYNRLILGGYTGIFVLGILLALKRKTEKGSWRFLWQLFLLGAVRSALWMYILLRNRDPVRITHSLYLAEFAFLAGMFVMQMGRGRRSFPEDMRSADGHFAGYLAAALLGIACICYMPAGIWTAAEEKAQREAANRGCTAIRQYCIAHPENFYFEDVYSTVRFSEKIFGEVDSSLKNYDIMGGWICKSPLYREKTDQFGIKTMEEGLLYNPAVFLIANQEEPEGDLAWLYEYYREKGIGIRASRVDLIDSRYAVYQIERADDWNGE